MHAVRSSLDLLLRYSTNHFGVILTDPRTWKYLSVCRDEKHKFSSVNYKYLQVFVAQIHRNESWQTWQSGDEAIAVLCALTINTVSQWSWAPRQEKTYKIIRFKLLRHCKNDSMTVWTCRSLTLRGFYIWHKWLLITLYVLHVNVSRATRHHPPTIELRYLWPQSQPEFAQGAQNEIQMLMKWHAPA